MTINRKQLATIGLLVLMAMVISGCAAGDPKFTEADPAGFWHGLWHGFIVVVTFVISLFSDETTIYEVNNSGGWYHFGYVLGML